jgi:hypothetical protein
MKGRASRTASLLGITPTVNLIVLRPEGCHRVRMISKSFVPFGGVHGWLADLTVSRRVGAAKAGFVKTVFVIESYYVAEPDERRAMTAIRAHAEAGKEAALTARRSLSRREIDGLGLKPGQVKAA